MRLHLCQQTAIDAVVEISAAPKTGKDRRIAGIQARHGALRHRIERASAIPSDAIEVRDFAPLFSLGDRLFGHAPSSIKFRMPPIGTCTQSGRLLSS
jgi:hypothetical protein